MSKRLIKTAFSNWRILHATCRDPLDAPGFHRQDGEGYRFLADQIIELDGLNPQIAARLLGIFGRWRRYDPDQQALMTSELKRVLAMQKLSRNSHEVATKSLG